MNLFSIVRKLQKIFYTDKNSHWSRHVDIILMNCVPINLGLFAKRTYSFYRFVRFYFLRGQRGVSLAPSP